LMDVVVDRLSRFLTELAAAPMDDQFPYSAESKADPGAN